jgi:hypothetical protein
MRRRRRDGGQSVPCGARQPSRRRTIHERRRDRQTQSLRDALGRGVISAEPQPD